MNEQKDYEIAMEIAGPFALWSRPDTGSTPTSYPIPTWSAAKGIFERIAFLNDGRAWINPTKVEICKPSGSPGRDVFYQKYTTNYRGPLKEKGKVNFQYVTLAISQVCYRLYANIENGSGKPMRYGNNPRHHLQAMFQRRLSKGQCHATPCLGISEFTPSYWGPIRDETSESVTKTEVDTSINLNLVSVTKQVFSKAVSGQYQPEFQTGDRAWIKKGSFEYD
ncbi:CRISPR-associated protein Cas5 [Paraneptunicella aestuarii]|uniref:CRISPR-associated protein Cas5 n=1 Tax=Paraneptunicella aestuarii TaxID=2831148 RepID=UPI001E3CC8BE|nr:CRISPR-associated protein Cas5 [Paraneptunicella aestuarii]UAA40145.1 CRISPR-associated protein Cas5 [Paraneptunicella aestuarii]